MTSEEAEKQSKTDVFSYYKQMAISWIFGIITIILNVYNFNIKNPSNSAYNKQTSYKDEYGNEYWHGKLIPKNEATIEEQEELKKLLSDIYEEE